MTHGSTILRNRSTAAERAASKSDTHWVDTFERFHPDCREILNAVPSKWGVDRNFGFVEDVVVPSIDRDLQVNADGSVMDTLPMPMPENVREIGWARKLWEAAPSGPETAARL